MIRFERRSDWQERNAGRFAMITKELDGSVKQFFLMLSSDEHAVLAPLAQDFFSRLLIVPE